jgi:hypothetical protein
LTDAILARSTFHAAGPAQFGSQMPRFNCAAIAGMSLSLWTISVYLATGCQVDGRYLSPNPA